MDMNAFRNQQIGGARSVCRELGSDSKLSPRSAPVSTAGVKAAQETHVVVDSDTALAGRCFGSASNQVGRGGIETAAGPHPKETLSERKFALRRLCLLLCFLAPALCHAQGVLIVADEFHAMQVLAANLEKDSGVQTRIIGQTEIPPSMASYRAVMVYLHGELSSAAEHKLIQYANDGGDLIVLHHTISSRKRENKDWFNFLHIELPSRPFADGGYAYFDPVTYQVVNLAEGSPLMKGVTFDATVACTDPATGKEQKVPGTTFTDTEVYVNHVLSAPRTLLLVIKYTDPKTNKVYIQGTAGWQLPTGKGVVFYFMMGHRTEDFENPSYRRLLHNAVEYAK
jgi:type 1 glutamine amidotransferase